MPTLRWRRKTSTPFFPGAWPNSSASDQDHDQRLPVYSDDAPPQLPELRHLSPRKHHGEDLAALAEEGWGSRSARCGSASRERRASQPMAMPSPASTSAPLSASLSQASTFSDQTDSEGVLTPQSIQGPLWLSPRTEAPYTQITKDSLVSESTSFYQSFDDQPRHDQDSFSHDTTIDTINVNTTVSSSNTADFHPHRGATRAAYRNPPLLDFSEPLPLTRISLDWEASPRLSQSPIQFSTPSAVGSPVLRDGEPAAFNPEAMATTFFPVPTSSGHEHSSETHEDVGQAASSPLTSPSAYSLGTDSPVLPADVGPIQNPQPPLNSPYTLMAGDLDAFAAAATSSSLSLPTSLHSALSEVLLADSEISERSPLPPPHFRAPSLVVAAQCGNDMTAFPRTPGADGKMTTSMTRRETLPSRSDPDAHRRMSAPLLHSPHTPVHRSTPRERRQTLSSRVEVQHVQDDPDGADGGHRPAKIPVFGKMRKLGGKFLSLFGGKIEEDAKTTVTKVEFESVGVFAFRLPPSPRRDSFLPIDDPESASKGCVDPLQHMRGSPSIQFKKDRGASSSDYAPQTPSSEKAPPAPVTAKQARRFSLSSALSRSRQSSLKSAVAGSKKGKERARPVSMVVSSSAARRAFLDQPQIRVQAPTPLIGPAASTSKEDVRARHTSMLVGKEKDVRRDMIEVAGSKFRMHKPRLPEGADHPERDREAATPPADVVQSPKLGPERVIEEASTELVTSASAMESPYEPALRERVPIERPGPDEVQAYAVPAPETEAQAPSRRFSLSSAISRRAMRARSMIVSVGRRSSESDRAANSSGSTDATATPNTSGTSSPRPPHRRGRGSTFSTIIDTGVRFDMMTPGFGFVMPTPTPSSPRVTADSPTTSARRSNDADFRRDRDDAPVPRTLDLEVAGEIAGMEEYPSPDSDLDSMSFAGTATLLESVASGISVNSSYADFFVDARSEATNCSMDFDEPGDTLVRGGATRLGEPFEGGEPVIRQIELVRASSTAVGSSGSSEGGTPMVEAVEREEERGFLRALGLELPVDHVNRLVG
ncbi:uncharacterized protein B0H18DRAFT_971548 [Fomitopsis serialis]|uniref:uncharacterized protein n=1 Tax=Fomitopsis serialis TaxID=139415 RepID=UPI00200851B2|nr:uncharacterized protein B0H18DRAFT_971548 [Neoantrodia serialis]KAH9937640.1 hypothetical protein B0H18DRAFT_971548 [Neoantrodia serialis]